jgi:hypothetical protein
MRFTWNETGDRVFDGPPTHEGLMGGFAYGVQQWLKRELKLTSIEDLDTVGARLGYYFLTIRQDDHTLLPAARFAGLALTDFAMVKHVVVTLDQDGDCGECHAPLDNRAMHLDGDSEPVPTSPPGGGSEG